MFSQPIESSDARDSILAATERLLADRQLRELSVADIVSEAGISRATFYFYFGSKYAVIASLLAAFTDEVFEAAVPFFERPADADPVEAIARSLEGAAQVWARRRPVLRATQQHWHAVPEIRGLWLDVVERLTFAVAAEIEESRVLGVAPPGPESRQLAAALLWATGRCLYINSLAVEQDLRAGGAALEPLVALWAGAVFRVPQRRPRP